MSRQVSTREPYGRQVTEVWPAAIFEDEAIGRFLVHGRAELSAIGKLRYDLFIRRDGKPYPFADHSTQTFLEPVDAVSLNFTIRHASGCAGGGRLTRARDGLDDPQLGAILRHVNIRDADVDTTVMNSRMVMDARTGGQMLIADMFRQVYRAGAMAQAKACILATRADTAPLFRRFGFVPLTEPMRDPVAGELTVVRLDLTNTSHLIAVRSPLLKVHYEFFGKESGASLEAAL